MRNKRVLILIPGRNARGGVNNYFNAIRDYLDLNLIRFVYRGSRSYPYHSNKLKQALRLITDYLSFIIQMLWYRIHLIHINMTLDRRGIFRDSIYLVLSKLFLKKVIVFYRGWDTDFEKTITKKHLRFFSNVFFRADASIVLGKVFKESLIGMGYTGPVYVETTCFNTQLTEGVNIPHVIRHRQQNGATRNLLYLSRIEKDKGIYICLDTFVLLKEKYHDLRLVYAGDGQDLENLKQMVAEKGLQDVSTIGHVMGTEKRDAYINSGIFIFPTFYIEGMPNAILEAMAFGLPVISSDVGGIPDVIQYGKNGFITNSKDAHVFAGLVEKLLNDNKLYDNIAHNNFRQAMDRYSSSVVAERLQNIYNEIS